MVATPCTSRCQSLAERSSMPAGICARQNDIGRPTTTYGSPWWPASAASASPNGPAPTIREIGSPHDTSRGAGGWSRTNTSTLEGWRSSRLSYARTSRTGETGETRRPANPA